MWGLNIRYCSLGAALVTHFDEIMQYSLRRINSILHMRPPRWKNKDPMIFNSVGLGTYGWKYGEDVIKKAINMGCLIDTAEGYGYGRVEAALGKIFAPRKQAPENIITKVSRSHMSPQALVAAGIRSHKRLGFSPYYQLHFPHNCYSDTQIGGSLSYMMNHNIIRSIGLGNCSVDMIESMQAALERAGGHRVSTVQIRYNLRDRRIEDTLIPYCQERGIIILAYSPLGQDFSTLQTPTLDKVAHRLGVGATGVALAWLLRLKGVLPIPRTNNVEHLVENVSAADIQLSQKDIKLLDKTYPYSPIS